MQKAGTSPAFFVLGRSGLEAGGLRPAKLAEVPPYHYGAVFEPNS